jgi:hypothetical protein
MASMMIRPESEDLQIVATLIKGMTIPAGVISYDITFDEDWTGDASIYILVKVNEKYIAAKKKHFRDVVTFTDEVQKQALQLGVSRWPYVRLVSGRGRRR